MEPANNQPFCVRSVLLGTIGFTLVSLAGFSAWAFGGSWFYKNVGEGGLYAVSTIIFIGFAGIFLHPLIMGERKLIRFYKAFIPAFVLYAVVWSVCWFLLKFGLGEWLGSLLGCAAFSFVLARSFKSTSAFLKVVAIMFVAHSAGYFLGKIIYMSGSTPPGFLSSLSKSQFSLLKKLLWGLFYGLGFGAGIGYAFHALQSPKSIPAENEKGREDSLP
jgi:hypothetical protein